MNKYVKREIDKYGSVLFLSLKEGLSDLNIIVTKELIIIGDEEISEWVNDNVNQIPSLRAEVNQAFRLLDTVANDEDLRELLPDYGILITLMNNPTRDDWFNAGHSKSLGSIINAQSLEVREDSIRKGYYIEELVKGKKNAEEYVDVICELSVIDLLKVLNELDDTVADKVIDKCVNRFRVFDYGSITFYCNKVSELKILRSNLRIFVDKDYLTDRQVLNLIESGRYNLINDVYNNPMVSWMRSCIERYAREAGVYLKDKSKTSHEGNLRYEEFRKWYDQTFGNKVEEKDTSEYEEDLKPPMVKTILSKINNPVTIVLLVIIAITIVLFKS